MHSTMLNTTTLRSKCAYRDRRIDVGESHPLQACTGHNTNTNEINTWRMINLGAIDTYILPWYVRSLILSSGKSYCELLPLAWHPSAHTDLLTRLLQKHCHGSPWTISTYCRLACIANPSRNTLVSISFHPPTYIHLSANQFSSYRLRLFGHHLWSVSEDLLDWK